MTRSNTTFNKNFDSSQIPFDSYYDLSHYFGTDHFKAGFTMRSFPACAPEDRILISKALSLDPSNLIIPKQVHGNQVWFCTHREKVGVADALISNSRDFVLSIQVADCVPLIILDNHANLCALVHAGWRSTANKIIIKTVNRMINKGSIVTDLRVLMGPSIGECCFEIGPEVAEQFPDKFLIPGKADRFFLNLQGVIKSDLIKAGMNRDQIFLMNECTFCHPERYHSFRRNGEKAGRMIAICGWV